MRKTTSILILFTMLLGTTAALASDNLPKPINTEPKAIPTPNTVTQNLDGIAAVVNSEIITQSELSDALAQVKKRMIAEHAKDIDPAQLRNNVLQQLINEKLQLQMAKNAGIKVSDADVNKAIAHIAQANHMTLNQLELKIKAQGLTMAGYRKMLQKQLIIHQVQLSAVGQKVHISQQDIQDFADKYKTQLEKAKRYHILNLHVGTDANDKDALKQAKKLMVEWKQGKLTKTPVDLGWESITTLPNIFIDQIKHMKPGDIAGPITAPNGFHIIKLEAVKNDGSSKMPTDAQIKSVLFQKKAQKEIQKWIEKIRKEAFIDIPANQ